MIQEADLEAAVAQGVVTTEQAASLRDLAEKRNRERAAALGHEERFQFMRSFNDFFFAIGVALLGGGMVFFIGAVPVHAFVAALVVWALSELLVARMRLVLPGILLVCFFVVFIAVASPVDLLFAHGAPVPPTGWWDWLITMRSMTARRFNPQWEFILIVYAGLGVLAALLYYIRFRLPFALLLVAGGLVGAVLAAIYAYWPNSAKQMEPLVLLASGILIFLAAMTFDASDRERLTRRADCAFWLHLLAAPLIVHSLIELVWPRARGVARMAANLSTETAVAIALIIAILAIVAIVVDRRALLVSALAYLGAVIGYAIASTIGQQGADKTFVFFATLLMLGILVLALGLGWQPLRRLFLRLLSPALANRLPPPAMRNA